LRWAVLAIAAVAMLTVVFGAAKLGDDTRQHGDVDAASALLYGEGILEAEQFSTVEEMTTSADLIVVGRVADVESGRSFGRLGIDRVGNALATIQVMEILGDSQAPQALAGTVLVEFFLGTQVDNVDSAREALVGTEGIWFLRDKEAEVLRAGGDAAAAAQERGYFRLVSSQGLVAFVDGMTVNVFGRGEGQATDLSNATNGRRPEELTSLIVQQLKD
jgi:hypothetical protein